MAALNDGGFIVEWGQSFGQESDGSADFDLVLQRFDKDGNAVGDQVIIDNPGDQGPFGVSLATLQDGRVIVTFNNETGDATNLTTLDYVILDPRNQTINGTGADDVIVGRQDASTINGLDGADNLTGMNGKDALNGGAGADRLTGGLGKDILFGGADADAFNFNSIRESKVKTPDVIKDFHHAQGDFIDLPVSTPTPRSTISNPSTSLVRTSSTTKRANCISLVTTTTACSSKATSTATAALISASTCSTSTTLLPTIFWSRRNRSSSRTGRRRAFFRSLHPVLSQLLNLTEAHP